MYSRVVTVLSTSGTQNITFSGGTSFTPKVAIVQYSAAATAAGFRDGASLGYGFTDGTNSRCIAYVSEDAVASSDTARIQSNNSLITALNQTGTITTVDAVATFTQWLTDGMQITWTNAPTTPFYIQVTFLGGSDLTNAQVGTLMTTTGASCSVTGMAWQPDFGMFLHGNFVTENSGSSTTPSISIGAAKDSSNQWNQTWSHVDLSGTSAAQMSFSHGRVVVQRTTTVTAYSVFSTWNADGFTLNNTDTYAVSHPIYYLVTKGGSIKVGNATEPGSTGNQTVTTSTDVQGVMILGADIASADTITASGMWSTGMGDSTTQASITEDELPASDPTANVSYYSASYIYNNVTANATAASSTVDDQASLGSVSSTGFVLNWNNIGNARTFRYITFGGVVLASVTKTVTVPLFDIEEAPPMVCRSLLRNHQPGITLLTAGSTGYAEIAGEETQDANETLTQHTLRPGGTVSRFEFYVSQNLLTDTASTGGFRINGADGNLAVSIEPAVTGLFSDDVNTDSIAAADAVNYFMIAGTGGTNIGWRHIGCYFQTTDQTITITKGSVGSLNQSSASITRYEPFICQDTVSLTEAPTQLKCKKAGYIKYLDVRVTANTRTTATTFRSRKNTADGAVTTSVAGSTTGLFEDTTHSDTIAVDDLINTVFITGTGTGTVSFTYYISFESTPNSGVIPTIFSDITGQDVSSLDLYQRCQGVMNTTGSTTETLNWMQTYKYGHGTLSNLGINVPTNVAVNAMTVYIRINQVNTSVSVSVPGGTTGVFENNADTTPFLSGSIINYRLIRPSDGGNVTYTQTFFYYNYALTGPFYTTPKSLIYQVGIETTPVMTDVVRFQKDTSAIVGATQEIFFQFDPKAIIVWSDCNEVDNTSSPHYQWSLGFSDGVNQCCSVVTSDDADTTTDIQRIFSDATVFGRMNEVSNSTIYSRATCEFITGGVRFTWTVNDNKATYINVWAIGGDDITDAKVGTTTLGQAGTGTYDYTGLGFNPANNKSILFTLGSFDTTPGAAIQTGQITFGAAVSPSKRWVISNGAQNSIIGAANTYRNFRNDACLTTFTSSSMTHDYLADFSAWINDGFQLNFTEATSDSTYLFSYLVIKGGTWDLGTLTSPSTPTTNVDTTTSISSSPLRGFLTATAGMATANTATDHMMMSMGAADTRNQACIGQVDYDNVAPTESRRINNGVNVIKHHDQGAIGSLTQVATFDSFPTNDSFRLDWGSAAEALLYGWIVVADTVTAVPITATRTHLYDILHEIPDTNTLIHDISQELTDTSTLRNDIMMEMATADINTLRYDILQEILQAKINTLLYDTMYQPVDTSTIKYDMMYQPVDTSTIRYDMMSQPVDTTTLREDIVMALTDTSTFLNDILHEVTDIDTFIQSIRQEVNPLGESNTLKFDIIGEILKTNSLLFDISALESVSKGITLLFDETGQPVKIGTIRYDELEEFTTNSRTFLYDVLITTTFNPRTFISDIMQEIQTPIPTLSLLYDIRREQPTAKSLTIRYDELVEFTTSPKTIIHSILESVTSDPLTLIYNIMQEIETPLLTTLRFDEIGQPLKTSTLLYDELQEITAAAKTFKHDIRHEVTDTSTRIFNILQELTAQTPFEFSFLFNILVQTPTASLSFLQDIMSQPVSTDTIIFEITTPMHSLTVGTTLLADIRHLIEDTNTFLTYIRAKAEQMSVTRYDVIGEALNTSPIRYDIREEMILAATRSFVFDIKQKVENLGNLIQDIRQETSPLKSLSLLYKITLDVESINTLLFDARHEMTKTNNLLQDIINGVVKQNLVNFSIIKEITGLSRIIFDIEYLYLGYVVKSLDLRFHVTQLAQQSISLLFDEISSVLETSSLLYDLRGSATNLTLVRWDDRGLAIADNSIMYQVFQDVQQDLRLHQQVRALTQQTSNLLWVVSQKAELLNDIKFDMISQPVAVRQIRYTINEIVTKVNTYLFNLMNYALLEPKSINFDIIKQVTDINRLLFAISGVPGVVGKSFDLLSDIRMPFSESNTIKFEIRELVSQTLSLLQQIWKAAIKQGVILYPIRKYVGPQKQFKFNIIASMETAKQCRIVFNSMTDITQQFSFLFQKLGGIRPATRFPFNITGEIMQSTKILAHIHQKAQQNLTLIQNLTQLVSTDATIRQDIARELAQTVTTHVKIYQEMTKQQDILYRIVEQTPELELSLKQDIIAQTTKMLKTLYDIRQVFEATRDFVYNIYPVDLTPKAILHEKLLDFIFSQYDTNTPPKKQMVWHEWYNGQADIVIDSMMISHNTIPGRSNIIYKERNYTAAIHIFYRDYSDNLAENRNIPKEMANVINEVQRILFVNRYNVSNEFGGGKHVYDMKIRDAKFIPEQEAQSSNMKILHYRFIVELLYGKLIV